MTVHVLHAGDGYTYLTRQVATGDHRPLRGEALTDYYLADGNPPGRWVGAGRPAMGIDGRVSEAQMKALFGQGLHPDADVRIAAAVAAGASPQDAEAAVRLGRRFPTMDHSGEVWRQRLDAAYADFTKAQGRRPERGPERDLIRWTVATELFRETHSREPGDDAELKAFVARVARPPRQPVAGVDLVFTPVKSVSVLWALSDGPTRTQVEAAHEAAWRRAFAFVEREAALTRTGKAGVAQIDTNGLVAAAFDHPDSRTGDPNLHTHVAVSAKVQGVDGLWRALDMRVLHALAVAASETYNTAIEDELRDRLGVEFVERDAGRDKRPVREIDGIPAELLTAFSSRRAEIQTGFDDALARYRATHGHDAPRTVQYRLAQEATLANRPDKAAPRSWATARAQWVAQAREVLGRRPFGRGGDLEAVIARVTRRGIPGVDLDVAARDSLASQAVSAVAQSRSTWTRWHVLAEVQRVTRGLQLRPADRDALVEDLTDRAITGQCLLLEAPEPDPVPGELRRRDGESLYAIHGAARYTSEPLILAVEDRLVAALSEHTVTGTADPVLEAAAAALEHGAGLTLDAGQRDLARSFVCDDRRLVVGIGPAGTGKTTAMRLAARTLLADGRRLVAVAPSARAAAVLAKEIGAPATTLAKLLHTSTTDPGPCSPAMLRPGDVVLVDEAGMASTPALGQLLQAARASGAVVRLLGDPKQLSSVGAGGALRLLAQHGDPAGLDRVHRFLDPAEAQATLGLRDGRRTALGFYEANGRLTDGTRLSMLDDIYDAWSADTAAGHTAVMVSASGAEAAALSARAHHDRVIAGDVAEDGVPLHDGSTAGVGDLVVTRLNRRTLPVLGGRDFVKNGDLWAVTGTGPYGAVRVTHVVHGGTVTLPAAYAAAHVELGYATTVHRAQGLTVGTAHVLVDKSMTRESLYVAMSRGRVSNRAYVVTDETVDVDLHHQPPPPAAAADVLAGVLAREGAERSATETIRESLSTAESLATIVPRYLDALGRAVATPELEAAVRAGLRDAGGPALEDRAAAGHGWHRLLVAAAGEDHPREAVAVAVRSELLDLVDPDHVAGALARRVARLGVEDDVAGATGPGRMPFRPPWIDPPPTHLVADPVAAWAISQDDRITSRVRALVDAVHEDPPPWAASIASCPEPGPDRDVWVRDVAVVAAYRDQHGIPDDVTQLGTQGDTDTPDATRAAVANAWARLTTPESPAATERAPSANHRIRALALRMTDPAAIPAEPANPAARWRRPDDRPTHRPTQPGIHR